MPTGISGLFKNTKGAREARGEKVKQTNFDRIKTMSAEELAVTIACIADMSRNPTIYGYSSDPSFIQSWLESEV